MFLMFHREDWGTCTHLSDFSTFWIIRMVVSNAWSGTFFLSPLCVGVKNIYICIFYILYIDIPCTNTRIYLYIHMIICIFSLCIYSTHTHLYIYVYTHDCIMYKPGTQMTLVLIGKDPFFGGGFKRKHRGHRGFQVHSHFDIYIYWQKGIFR